MAKTEKINETNINEEVKGTETTEVENNVVNDIDDLKKALKEQQEQNKMLMEQFQKLMEMQNTKTENTVGSNPEVKERKVSKIDMSRQVTLVHLEDRFEGLTTFFKSSNREYNFQRFGETLDMTYAEFQEVFTRNRSMFEQNIIALSSDDEDIASMPQYNMANRSNSIQLRVLEILPELTEDEIEDIFSKICEAHKELMIRKWTQGYFEAVNETPNHNRAYLNYGKIYKLNELSGDRMRVILDDMANKKKTLKY